MVDRLYGQQAQWIRGVWISDRLTICDCRVAFATEKMKDGDEYGVEGSEKGGGKGDDESGNAQEL